jgi:hypothetical protein
MYGKATIRPLECSSGRLYVHLSVNRPDQFSYAPVFTGRFLIFLAALLSPLYFWYAIYAVIQFRHSASTAWLPVSREVLGDVLKPAVFFYFGFYFKGYRERRASFKARRRDVLQMVTLCGLFFAAVSSRYVFLFALVGCVLVYLWEMRDIRRDELHIV